MLYLKRLIKLHPCLYQPVLPCFPSVLAVQVCWRDTHTRTDARTRAHTYTHKQSEMSTVTQLTLSASIPLLQPLKAFSIQQWAQSCEWQDIEWTLCCHFRGAVAWREAWHSRLFLDVQWDRVGTVSRYLRPAKGTNIKLTAVLKVYPEGRPGMVFCPLCAECNEERWSCTEWHLNRNEKRLMAK